VAGIVFFVVGNQEIKLWLDYHNFTTFDGTKIDNFCGNFLHYISINAVYGNIIPSCMFWFVMVCGVVYSYTHRTNYMASIVFWVYVLFFCWATIIKAISAINYKTTDKTCIDFWNTQGLGQVLTFLDREVNLLILTAIVAAPMVPLFLWGCCQCLCMAIKQNN
jgi:hypothetical protein